MTSEEKVKQLCLHPHFKYSGRMARNAHGRNVEIGYCAECGQNVEFPTTVKDWIARSGGKSQCKTKS